MVLHGHQPDGVTEAAAELSSKFGTSPEHGAKLLKRWPFRFLVIARKEFLTANPGVDAKVVAALKDGIAYVGANRGQAADWFAASLRIDPATVKTVLEKDGAYTATSAADVDLSLSKQLKDALGVRVKLNVDNKVIKAAPTLQYAGE